jgi:transposase-like protein
MRRSTITEQQRAAALLLAAGQHEYKEIARMIGVHRNSIGNWLKNRQVQALVSEFQENIQHKLEDMSIEATRRKHDRLIVQAVEKLEKMLTSKSTRRQLEAIKFLMTYGPLPEDSHHEQPQGSQGQLSSLRLDPQLQSRLRVTQS